MEITRRTVLSGGAAAGALTVLAAPGSATGAPGTRPLARSASPRVSPFELGVASGDPLPDSVVLWTRLAVDPTAEDGLGGMARRPYAVRWEIARDPQMRRVVERGVVEARAESGYAVHVEPRGLQSGREYWYRFRVGGHLSPVGRTMTAPARHEMPAVLAMSFASCSQYEHGYFTAYRRLAQDQPDLVLHLGDYQYEYTKQSYLSPTGNVRDHDGPETVDLASYRQRHAQYKSDPDLQLAHATAPWLVVWDDHEVDNNWADDVPENSDAAQWNDTTARFVRRRAQAFQAYYENMPLRRASVPRGADMKIYRRLHWGRLATFHMMDTRQYRDDQACGDGWTTDCDERLDETRSLPGMAQERWLLDGFERSRARWDVLGQQVFFAEQDALAGPSYRTSMDGWDGYVPSRRRITQGWVDAGVRNPVVLTGDVHKHWANDLRLDYQDTDSPVVGSELVCSSITSTGNGSPTWQSPNMALNPHLRFSADQRGYVRTAITKEKMSVDYRSLPSVTSTDAAAYTQASFELHDGQRGLQRTR